MSVVVIASRSIRIVFALSLCWTGVAGASDPAPAAPPLVGQQTSPPDETDMQADLRRTVSEELKEFREKGFIPISEAELNSFMRTQLAQWFTSPNDVLERTQILYELAVTAQPLKFEGMFAVPAPDGLNRYYSVVRVYTLPGDITVTLEETDFASIGAKVSQVKEMINTEINGYAGTATYRRAPSQKGLVVVSWITESRLLKLSLAGAGVGPEQRATALALARAVGKQ